MNIYNYAVTDRPIITQYNYNAIGEVSFFGWWSRESFNNNEDNLVAIWHIKPKKP